jgi:hypothetical protein
MKPLRVALFFVQSDENATLSYQHGWPQAFLASSLCECTPFNLAGRSLADRIAMARRLHLGKFDAVVLLHSVFSNQQNLRGALFWAMAACRVPKIYFIGNEYKLMPEKMRFCRRLGISLLISQSNDERVMSLYRNALGCKVASVPNTGFDESVFFPVVAMKDRRIDLGYRAYDAPWYLGNIEKMEIAEYFAKNAQALGLAVDISLDVADRFDSAGYAAFLNRCRGQIGTESGGDYFELTDVTRLKVFAYLTAHQDATWKQVEALFFTGYGNSVPMRILSGRQVEAAACKTVQVLFEGRYNGYLQPDQHYIPLKADYSNIDDVMRKFRDDDFCRRVVDSAYEVALQELTYPALMNKVIKVMHDTI